MCVPRCCHGPDLCLVVIAMTTAFWCSWLPLLVLVVLVRKWPGLARQQHQLSREREQGVL